MAPCVEPLEQRLPLTTISLNGPGDLVIESFGLANDQLSIHADGSNNQFVISDPGQILNTGISGATGSGTNQIFLPFGSVPSAKLLIVNTSDGSDVIRLTASNGFAYSLAPVLDGGDGLDAIELNAAVSVPTDDVNVMLISEDIRLGSDIATAGGKITFQGNVFVTHDVSLQTDGAATDGDVEFFGQVQSSAGPSTYTLINTPRTYEQARMQAGVDVPGGYLVTIRSAAEQAAVAAVAGANIVWLGATDIEVEGKWVWDSGPDFGVQFWEGDGTTGNAVGGEYSNWVPGVEPDNIGGPAEADALVLEGNELGGWKDHDPMDVQRYIVEAPSLFALSIGAGNALVKFQNQVGNFLPLRSLTLNAGQTELNGGSVRTAKGQTFNSTVSLMGPTQLVAEEVNFGGGANSVIGSSGLMLAPIKVDAPITVGAPADSGPASFDLTDTDIAALSSSLFKVAIGESLPPGGESLGFSTRSLGPVTVTSATFSSQLSISGGSISVTGLDVGTQTVELTTVIGTVTDGGNGVADVTANELLIDSAAGIGASSNPLDIAVGAVSARAVNGGGVFLANTGNLVIGSAFAPGGILTNNDKISVSATGSISVNQQISSNGDDVTLTASNGITIHGVPVDTGGGQFFADADSDNDGLGTFTLSSISEFVDWTSATEGSFPDRTSVNITTSSLANATAQVGIGDTRFSDGNIYSPPQASGEFVETSFSAQGELVTFSFAKPLFGLFLHFDGMQYQGTSFDPATDNPINLYAFDQQPFKVSGESAWDVDLDSKAIRQLSGDHLADQDGTVRFNDGVNSLTLFRQADGVSLGNESIVNVQLGLFRAGVLFTGGEAITIRAADMILDGFIEANTGLVTLIPSGTNRTIDLGSTSGVGQFVLTDQELDRISTTSGLLVGDTSTGKITINDTITRFAATNFTLTVANGQDIVFSGPGAMLNTNGGNVTLTTGGTGAILSGSAVDDLRASAISLNAGSGGIGESGNPLAFNADALATATSGNGDQFLREVNDLTIGTTGLNAGSGIITLDNGVFRLGGPNRIGDATTLSIEPSAALQLNGFVETLGGLSDSGSVFNGSTTAGGLTISGSGDSEFFGSLGGVATTDNNFSLTKSGSGRFALSGVGTFLGTTTVNGGTLVINGSTISATTVTSGGTLGGDGMIDASVTINNGGTLAPGNSPGVLRTGDLSLASGSTLTAEINGNIPGELHDQVDVSGTVNLGGATLSPTGTVTTQPGQLIVLINNDGTDAISGTFAGLAEGATVTINGVDFVLSYRGGTGNDVTLTEAGTFVFQGTRFDDSLEIREAMIGGQDYLQIVMGGVLVEQRLTSSASDVSILGGDGNDVLTIDYGGSGGFFNKLISFEGGDPTSGLGDSLVLTGGSFLTVNHFLTNASDGSVEINGFMVVSYTGLEPITDDLSATDRGFNFGAGAETITLTDATGSAMTIDSPNSESVTFANPSRSLSINAGAGDDTVQITSVDAAFHAALTINGGLGTDTVSIDTNLVLGSGNNTGSVSILSESIQLNANISTDAGTNAGPIGLVGAVQLGANVTLDSNSTNGTDANITFGDSIDGARTLTTNSGGSATTFNGAIGETTALTDLDVTAGTINLNADIKTDGGSLTFVGNTVLGAEVIISTEVGEDDSAGSVTFSGGSLSATGADHDLTITTVTNGPNNGGSVTFARVDNAAGNSVRSLSVYTDPLGSGSAGDVTFMDSVNLANDGGLYAEARTISLSTSNSDLTLSGAANVFLSARRNIDLAPGSSIQAVDGDVTLDANQFATPTTGNFTSIQLDQATIRTTGIGSINLLGRSGDASNLQYGILLRNASLIEATGTGQIELIGESRGTSGPENDGILIASSSDILSNSGQIILRGIRGVGSTAEGIGVTNSGVNISTISAPIFLLADVIHIGTTQPEISAGSDNVIFLRPITPGTAIGLGAESSSVFSLSDAQLDRLTSGAIQIGDSDSGTITINDNITRPVTTNFSLITGGNSGIVFTGSSATLDSNNGEVTLFLNPSGAGAITSGGALKDVRGINVFLTSGSGGIGTDANPLITDASSLFVQTSGDSDAFLSEIDSLTIRSEGLSVGSGTIVFASGLFRLGGAERLSNDGSLLVKSGAVFQLNGFNETVAAIAGDGSIINGTALSANLTVGGGSSSTFAGVLGGATANDKNFGLTKSGNGVLTLSGANTYTGTTAVSGGTLLINGSVTSNVTVESGATIGGTGTLNSGNTLTAQNGATVAPGNSPGILRTGDVSFVSGATFAVEVNGDVPAGLHDQLDVTGTVDLGGATLSATGTITTRPGQSIVLIANDGTEAIVGTFAGLAEGATVTINGVDFVLSYRGGTGNDVTLIESGTMSFIGSTGDDAIEVREATISGSNYLQIVMDGILVTQRLSASVTDLSIAGSDGNDTLTIDYGGNGFFNKLVTFDGGNPTSGSGDRLTLTGGSFTTVKHTFTNASDGSVSIDGMIALNYTGLEPITDNLNATDRTFDFTGDAETITLSDAGTGTMTIDSTLGESVTFVNPTGSLTITDSGASGNDTIIIDSVDAAFRASLTIDGGVGNDTVTLNGALNLSSGTSAGHLDITAERINLNANISTDGGFILLRGDIVLGVSVTIDTEQGSDSNAGLVGLNGSAISASSPNLELTIDTRTGGSNNSGAVTLGPLNNDAGGQFVRDVTVTAANTGSGVGGVVTFTGNVTLAADGNLAVDAQTIDLAFSNVVLSGAGKLDFEASRNITVGQNGIVTVVDGDLTMNANQGVTPTSGSFDGIWVTNGGIVQTTGTGNIHLAGRSGDSGLGSGIRLSGTNSTVRSTSTAADAGTITLQGTGASATNTSRGVLISTLATVTSVNGDITLLGTGGDAAVSDSSGVEVIAGAVVSSTGTSNDAANIVVTGNGGSGTSFSVGVLIQGAGTKVTTIAGDISLQGTGGAVTDFYGEGVLVFRGAEVSSTGTGPGAGALTIVGTGGGVAGSNENYGVDIDDSGATVTSVDGDISITATGGVGAQSVGFLLGYDTQDGFLTSTGTADISIVTDSVRIESNGTLNAGTNRVTIRPQTSGTEIELGGADAASVLGLTDAELDRITAGTLVLGDSNSGGITVVENIDLSNNAGVLRLNGEFVMHSSSSSIRVNQLAAVSTGANIEVIGNQIGTIAFDSQNQVSFNQTSAVTIGAVDGVNGVSSVGQAIISVEDGLTIANTPATNDLVTAGGFFIEVSGNGGFFILDAGARILDSFNDLSFLGADHMQIAGEILATNAEVELYSVNATGLDIGSTTDVAVGVLELSQAELNHITAKAIVVYTGAITVSATTQIDNTATLSLNGSDVTATAGGLLVSNLQMTATGAVTFTHSDTDVDTVMIRADDIQFVDADGFTVDSIDVTDGIFANGGVEALDGQAALTALTGNIDVANTNAAQDVSATAGIAITLSGSGSQLTISSGANVSSTVGGVQIDSDNTALNGTIDAGSDGITFTGGTATLGAAERLANSSPLMLNSSAVLKLSGFHETLSSLTGNGSVTNGSTTASTLTINLSGNEAFNGVLGGAGTNDNNFGLTKTGSGTLTLNKPNTYAGPTNISAGALKYGDFDVLSDATAVTVSAPGTLNLFTFGDRVASIAGNGTINLGSAPLEFGDDNSSTSFSGTMTGTGQLVKNGNGTFTLTGSITAGGNVTVNSGTFRLGSADRIADTRFVALGNGATFDLAGFNETVGGIDGGVTSAITLGAGTLTTGGLNIATQFFGAISGTGGLVKEGSAALSLERTNSYTGATSVNAGTLLVNGSITSDVTVANGATIGGKGTIGSGNTLTVQSGGNVAPGTSPGILTTGNVSFESGSVFNIELNGTTVGTQYDQLNVLGTVAIGSNVELAATLNFTPSPGASFVIINNDGSDAVSGTFQGLPQGSLLSIGGEDFHIFYNHNSGDGQFNDVALIANRLPVVNDQSFRTNENDLNTAVIGTVIATDADSAVTFAITAGNTSGAFIIDSNTGIIRVNNSAAMDFETNPTFSLTVQVTDDAGATDTATITINLNDLQGNLSINSVSVTEGDSGTRTLTFTVTLSASINRGFSVEVATATGTAGDGSGGSDTDFAANSDTLSFLGSVSEQHTFDVTINGDNVAEANETLAANLSNLLGTNDVTITVASGTGTINNDDFAPVADAGGPYSIIEGSGVTLDASGSTDSDSASLTYRWDVDGDGDFDENITGVSPVVSAATLQTLGLGNGPDSSTVTVEVSDGVNIGAASTTLTVDNVAPSTPTDNNAAVNSVAENATNGTSVGITASSNDIAADTVTFSLTNNAGGRFAIDGSSGVVTVANASLLNFENATSHSITVQASDGTDVSTASFTIAVTNVAPSIPTDADGNPDRVSEGASNGDLVGIDVNSSDIHGGTVTFRLTDDAGGRFAIHPATGVVRVANVSLIDFESAVSHTITVEATDGTDLSTATFTIAVTNVAPSVPVDADPTSNAVTGEIANGRLVGIDADSSDVNGGTVTFSLTDDAGGRFAIEPTTGVVTVANASLLDVTNPTSYSITVQASDVRDFSTKSFTIRVGNAAPTAPFDVDNQSNTVPEMTLPGSRVGITLFATDPDGQNVFYRLTDDAGGRFVVDPLTGVVMVRDGQLLRFAEATQHAIRAVAVDALGNVSDEVAFNVVLTAVSENALPLALILPTRVSVVEGDAGPNFITFLVKLNKPSAETITVDFTTRTNADVGVPRPEGLDESVSFATDEPGLWDFFRSAGRLTFDPGVTEQPLRVQIRPDDRPEDNEFFFVQLLSPVNVRLAPQQSIAIAQILDDDVVPQLIVENSQVLEGDSAGQNELVFSVRLVGDLPLGETSATVDFLTGNIAIDTASDDTDYISTSGTLTFTDSDRVREVRIPILGDLTDEANKTFSLRFENPAHLGLSRSEVVGTIINDDSPNVVIALTPQVFKIRENNDGSQQVEFFVTLIGKPTGPVSVDYTTTDETALAGSDYTATSGTIEFTLSDIAIGNVQRSVLVTIAGDTVIEPDETLSLALSLPTGSLPEVSLAPDRSSSRIVIRNDDQAILTEVGDALALALSNELTAILGGGPKNNPALIAALRQRALEIIRTQGLDKAIVLIIDPVDFVLTDPDGRQAGYTEGTGVVNEIPGTYYSGDGAVELLIVPLPPDGTYNVQLAGLGGDFNASITVLDRNGTSTNIVSQTLSEGATSSVSFQVGGNFIPIGLGLAAAQGGGSSAVGVVGAFGQQDFRLALASAFEQAIVNALQTDGQDAQPPGLMLWLSVSARVVRQQFFEPLWQSLGTPFGDWLSDGRLTPRSIPPELVDQFWSQLGQTLTGVPSGIYRLGDMLESLIPTLLPGRNRSAPRAGEQGQTNPGPGINGVPARRSSLQRPRSAPTTTPPAGSGQAPPSNSKATKDKSVQTPATKKVDGQQSSTSHTRWLWFTFKDEKPTAKPTERRGA